MKVSLSALILCFFASAASSVEVPTSAYADSSRTDADVSLSETDPWGFAYRSLRMPAVDSSRTADVRNLELVRDAARFELKEGRLFLLQSIPFQDDTVTTGAVFLGKGTFHFTPPTDIERQQLARFYKEETLSHDFRFLLLRFADSTSSELERMLTFDSGPVPHELEEAIHYAGLFFHSWSNDRFTYSLYRDLLNRTDDASFYAHIANKLNARDGVLPKPLIYTYDPGQVEEVALENRWGTTFRRQTVSRFNRSPRASGRIPEVKPGEKDEVRLRHYDIEAELSDAGELEATARVYFKVRLDTLRSLKFALQASDVHSVLGPKEEDVPFHKDGPYVSVFFGPPLVRDSSSTLSFRYDIQNLKRTVRAIEAQGKISELGTVSASGRNWYPVLGFRERTTFDLTFRVPV
jgi:hypothetical protein